MNLLDHKVEKVISMPYKEYNHWFVLVEYSCCGFKGKGLVMIDSEQEANKVVKGYVYKA